MQAIICEGFGDENVMRLDEVASPSLAAGQVRLQVNATALNRADLLQRKGLYPPPPGASEILGLECAGEISEIHQDAGGWRLGQRVMALLPGGGYAEQVVVDGGSLLATPAQFSDHEAAGFMETALTAFLNIFLLAGAEPGTRVLVHGGSGGVGTAAIALCQEAGIPIWVTAGSDERCQRCLELGATAAVNYRQENFAKRVRAELGGVDVVLDCIGASYWERNIACLAPGGTLLLIGLMGGSQAEVNLASLLQRRLRIIGSTLRSRGIEEKAGIVSRLKERFGAALDAGRLRPVIDQVLPLAQAAQGHRLLAQGEYFGKIVLSV